MIEVKFNDKFSQDGYQYRTFDNYEDFGYWYIKNFNKITIWNIKEE